jgi:hypothetical protein
MEDMGNAHCQPLVGVEDECAVPRLSSQSGMWWNIGCEDVKVKSGPRSNEKWQDVKEKLEQN